MLCAEAMDAMTDKREAVASYLNHAGFILLFCAGMMVLAVLPFTASPFAAKYRTEGRQWEANDDDPFRRAVVFLHTHASAVASVFAFCVVAGGCLVITGRRLFPVSSTTAAEREPQLASEPEESRELPERVVVNVAHGRSYVPLDIAAAISSSAMCIASIVSRSPSGILCGFGMGGFILFVMLALHHASCRTILLLQGKKLVVRQKNAFLSNDRKFDVVDDVYLAKSFRGHGVMPVSIDSVRQEYQLYHTDPRVNGLCVSSSGRMKHVLLPLPFENLLTVAEAVLKFSNEARIDKPKGSTQQTSPT